MKWMSMWKVSYRTKTYQVGGPAWNTSIKHIYSCDAQYVLGTVNQHKDVATAPFVNTVPNTSELEGKSIHQIYIMFESQM